MIKIQNVNYTYQENADNVLNNLNLEIKAGDFYTIYGNNDHGKTTLGLLLRGFIPKLFNGVLTGSYEYNNKDINELTMDELCQEIGYVFQNPFSQITTAKDTVYEEIAFGLENLSVSREDMIKRVDYVIDLLKLEAIKDKNPLNLSGGQKQKVAIASIIVMEPKLLILDEPTSQLDPVATREIFEILKQLNENGTTIILIEHKIELIDQYTNNLILLKDGEVLINDAKEAVYSSEAMQASGLKMPLKYEIQKTLNEESNA